MTVGQIIEAIEQAAPRCLQEQWDNSGLICGSPRQECRGVMVCLDVTPSVVSQAIETGCNLIVSHHPLIFKGIKAVSDTTVQGEALIMAIKSDIAVYSAHTSLDNAPAPWGVSHEMARLLGAEVESVISPTGTGVFAKLSAPATPLAFLEQVKKTFDAKGVRHSVIPNRMISKIALGSGSCGFLIPDAIYAGADAIVTSDVRYHDFLDYGKQIFIVDLTHFDTEKITKAIFRRIISQKISNFALVLCASEPNPIEFK